MRRRWMILGLPALLIVLAGRFLSSGSADTGKDLESALVHRSCAPWDGPAVEIELYSSRARCGAAQASSLRMAFWRDLPPKAGQKLDLGIESKSGAVSYCRQENQCERAKSATVEIESYEEGKGASGRYDLAFPKAGHMTGRFHAEWCVMHTRCG